MAQSNDKKKKKKTKKIAHFREGLLWFLVNRSIIVVKIGAKRFRWQNVEANIYIHTYIYIILLVNDPLSQASGIREMSSII